MLSKSIILIFSAFLMLQTQALSRMRREAGGVAFESKPINSIAEDSKSATSEKSGEVKKPLQVLMTTTLMDLVGLAKYITEHGQPLMKKALAQLEALPEKSPALQANITRIADSLKNNPKDIDAAEERRIMASLESMIHFTEIMKDLDGMPAELEQTKILKKAFNDNDCAKFERDLMAELKVVTGKFEKAIEKYLTILQQKQTLMKTSSIHLSHKNTRCSPCEWIFHLTLTAQC